MKLKSYLAEIGMSVKDFSALVGCNYRYMSRIMNGHTIPGKRLKKNIEDLTCGQVELVYKNKRIKQAQQDSKD
jgi:hypothetical protein